MFLHVNFHRIIVFTVRFELISELPIIANRQKINESFISKIDSIALLSRFKLLFLFDKLDFDDMRFFVKQKRKGTKSVDLVVPCVANRLNHHKIV